MLHTLTRCITLIINLHFKHSIYLEPDISLAVCLHTVGCKHSILIDQEERAAPFSKFCC